MTIEWLRLVNDEGQTCDRCAATGDNTEVAFEKLKRCLVQIGIDVVFKKHTLDQSAFLTNPVESNKIKIDGKSMEQWLDGTAGQSRCCGPCGDSECRTITVDGITHEAIPENLVIRAGLLAAAEIMRVGSPEKDDS